MAKKRKTREQKTRATLRRQENEAMQVGFPGPRYEFVNREKSEPKLGSVVRAENSQRANILGQSEILASSPSDLLKTFLISSGILSLEAVLYFAWK